MNDASEAGLWRVLERVDGVLGELVLRERDTDDGVLTDLVCNGVQVMDDADAGSEVALALAALDALGGAGTSGPHVVVGGLGMAFTLAALLADPRLGPAGRVTVVEVEPAVVRWNGQGRFPATAGSLDDPRVAVRVGDVADVLGAMGADGAGDGSPGSGSGTGADEGGVDAVLLDVDNGPGFLVAPANAVLYDEAGLALAAAALRPGGVLAVWSAQAAPELGASMGRIVGPASVRAVEVEREGRPLRYWVHLALRR